MKGFSFIELLISLFLFSLILLAFDVMQMTAWHMNQSAYFLSTASFQIHSMKERLQALGQLPNLSEQVNKWNIENQMLLPEAQGKVVGQYPHYRIELCWTKKKRCLYAQSIWINAH